MLKPFGFIVARGNVCAETFRDRVITALAEATSAGIDLADTIKPLLDVQAGMADKIKAYDKRVKQLAETNPVCRRLMTVPGVGPVTALTYYTAIDDPHRFKNPEDIGAYFGLTPRQFQSGESDYMGRISKRGDQATRLALVQAATVLLTSQRRWCPLRAWGLKLVKRVGFNKAKVAVARKLAILLHRLWVNETEFVWTRQPVEAKAAA